MRTSANSKKPEKTSRIGSTMNTIMLTCLTAFLLLIFTKIGYNKTWFEKVQYYFTDFIEQKDSDASLETIRESRLGPSYKMSKEIQKYFEKKHIQNPVVLFEPNTYIEKAAGFKMPEPIVFYYFTGLKSVWMNSRNVAEATHFVYFRQRNMYIDTIPSSVVLKKLIIAYKPYPTTL